MRIITGIYKGRHFDIPRSFKARPTTDFAKENIFNVIGARPLCRHGQHIARDAVARLLAGDKRGGRPRPRLVHPRVYEEDICRPRQHPHPRRRLPLHPHLQTTVRPHLRRPTLRSPRAADHPRPHPRKEDAQARRSPGLRAWQEERLQLRTRLHRAQSIRQRQLLAVQNTRGRMRS